MCSENNKNSPAWHLWIFFHKYLFFFIFMEKILLIHCIDRLIADFFKKNTAKLEVFECSLTYKSNVKFNSKIC